ncbi:MAG: IS66 family insertion sequence element accessory protein TnpB [Oscillospiraceae bacterium]
MMKEAHFEQVYIVCRYTDMRLLIYDLGATVKQNFGLKPCSGSLFLFCGKRHDRLKALLLEGDGFLLMYKCQDNGSFQ